MRIDSDGDVGIGTTSPQTKLQIEFSGAGTTLGSAPVLTLKNTSFTNSNRTTIVAQNSVGGNVAGIDFININQVTDAEGASGGMGFWQNTSGTKAYSMFVAFGGSVVWGATSVPADNAAVNAKAIREDAVLGSHRSTTGALPHNYFFNPNGLVGKIETSGSSTSYLTSSDYRLKENVNYNFDATTRLKQLKPARFNFKADANKTVDGFLAHEVQSVIPEAITGIKDETKTKEKVVINVNGQVIAENIEQVDWETGKIPNEEGKSQYPVDSTWEASKVVPVHQGIDQSKLTPLLTKALQEAIAKIEQLEARLTALENNNV